MDWFLLFVQIQYYLVNIIFIGILLWLGFIVYDKVFTHLTIWFGIKKDFSQFMWNKRKNKNQLK